MEGSRKREEVRKGRGPEIVLFSGKEEEVGRKIQHGDLSPPFSRLNRVALDGHGGDR